MIRYKIVKHLHNIYLTSILIIDWSLSLQVILVGHSSGGACISHALELLPEKISKAVYLCATMISDGQRPFDVFDQEVSDCLKISSLNRLDLVPRIVIYQ